MTQIPFIKNDFILKNGYIPYVYGTKCDKFYTLNNDAKDILSKFNGKDSIEEISQQLAIERNENAEDINSTIESLIASTNFLSSSKNMIDIYLSYNDENVQYPSHISFELTSDCNYKCKHCYNNCEPDKNEKYMDKDEIITILNQLREIGVLGIELTGGEPFLHPNFEEIVIHGLKLFNIVAIITNGSLITEKFLKSLKEYRHKLSFQVPLHSVDSGYMDDFCGNKCSFMNSEKAINLLTKYGFLTRVGMIITPDNINSMVDTAMFAQSFIVKNSIFSEKSYRTLFFAFSVVIPVGRSNSFKNIVIESEEVFREMQNNLKICDEKFGDFIYKDDPKIYDDDQHCGVGITSVAVDNSGNLKLCDVSYYKMGKCI
ncbi:MAG: radical SAM protein [Methanobrevibacter sp.]|jgi:MoaA/NifB/PqqE/SkfB family radical SAM enzyme|nr:radical SAM protein [Candidatus Methanovirga procula]